MKDGVRHLYVGLCRLVSVVWPTKCSHSILCCAKTCFVAHRRMGERGRLQGGCVTVAIDRLLALQAR